MGVSGLEHEDQAHGAHRVRGRLSNFPCAAFHEAVKLIAF